MNCKANLADLYFAFVVSNRPAMYLGSNFTFQSLITYLNGYYDGLNSGRLPQSNDMQVIPNNCWDFFRNWLTLKNINLDELQNSGDKLGALKYFRTLLSEYQSDTLNKLH